MLIPSTGNLLIDAKNFSSADSKQLYDINLPFTIVELRAALAASHESTLGLDNINYSILQHLPNESLQYVLKLFNKFFEIREIPSNFKHSIITPLLKPGKDPQQASSYRSIASTSCMGKIWERMVTNAYCII